MAIHAHSTTAPARPLLALVPFALRLAAPVSDSREPAELLEEIRRTIEAQEGLPRFGDTPELPPEPLLSADLPRGVAGDWSAQSRSVGEVGFSDVVPSYPGTTEVAPNYPDAVGVVADHARTIHLRRQLAQAAEHGAALLASLGLPRLVGPDHIVVDPVAAGDALDLAIATLDALDGDTDLEPYLAGFYNGLVDPNGERESGEDEPEDDGTSEPSLASPERHPPVPVCFSGGPFTARGGDESQLRWAEGARHDGELVNEDGDDLDRGEYDTADHESHLGWPEDIAAVTSGDTWVLTADPDAEHDDADLEGAPAGDLTWVFGPSRREVAHV